MTHSSSGVSQGPGQLPSESTGISFVIEDVGALVPTLNLSCPSIIDGSVGPHTPGLFCFDPGICTLLSLVFSSGLSRATLTFYSVLISPNCCVMTHNMIVFQIWRKNSMLNAAILV